MKVLAEAIGAPTWANGGHDTGTCALIYPPDATHVPDFARYAAGLVQHGADAVEVWNEENNRGFWQGTRDPQLFAQLQVAAYASIKAMNPAVPVITGGLAPVDPDTDAANLPENYFSAAMSYPGFDRSFDAVGHHPYTYPHDPLDSYREASLLYQTAAIHDVMVAHGVGALPIWFTEFGVPTGGGSAAVPLAQQGTHFQHFFTGVDMLRANGINVGDVFVWTLTDNSATNYEGYFGLFASDGTTEKPGAPVVRAEAHAPCH
jgi:hypothetical protein